GEQLGMNLVDQYNQNVANPFGLKPMNLSAIYDPEEFFQTVEEGFNKAYEAYKTKPTSQNYMKLLNMQAKLSSLKSPRAKQYSIQNYKIPSPEDLAKQRADVAHIQAQTSKAKDESVRADKNILIAAQAAGVAPNKVIAGKLSAEEANAIGLKYKEMFGGNVDEIAQLLQTIIGAKIKKKFGVNQKSSVSTNYGKDQRIEAAKSLEKTLKGMPDAKQRLYLNRPDVKKFMDKWGLQMEEY
ncbi:MAG: hypothetical protein AB1397_05380, partial [bacterium]